MVNGKDVNESYVKDGARVCSGDRLFLKLKMLGCNSKFRMRCKLFRQYWSVSSSARLYSSVPLYLRRDRRLCRQWDGKAELFQTTWFEENLRVTMTHNEINENCIERKNKYRSTSPRTVAERFDWLSPLAFITEWRPGSTGQILSDLDLTSQKEGRWKRINTLAHYNVSTDNILVSCCSIFKIEGIWGGSGKQIAICRRVDVNGVHSKAERYILCHSEIRHLHI